MPVKKHTVNQMEDSRRSGGENIADGSRLLRADAQQNREQILEAARQIFAEKGLSVPIGEIARRAGVGIGTVYRHFPTKEALFEAVNISHKQQLTAEAKSLLNHPDPGKAFFDFFSRFMEEGFSNRALKDAFQSGALSTRTGNSDVLKDFRSAYDNLLIRAQQAKAVREDIDGQDLSTLVFGLLMAIEQTKGTPDIIRFKRLLSIVIEGLRYRGT